MTSYERKMWVIIGQGVLVVLALITLIILAVTDTVSKDYAERAFAFVVGLIGGGTTVSVAMYLSDEERQRVAARKDMERRIRDAILEDQERGE